MQRKTLAYLFAGVTVAYAPFASAYIGPGLGSGAIVAVLGTLFGLLLLIVGVVWYPLKKLIRRLWPKK